MIYDRKKYAFDHTGLKGDQSTRLFQNVLRLKCLYTLFFAAVVVVVVVESGFYSIPQLEDKFFSGSPSRGWDVLVYVFDINQPSSPTPFYSVLVSISVFMALSTVFPFINSPDNSPLPHSVHPVLCLPYD